MCCLARLLYDEEAHYFDNEYDKVFDKNFCSKSCNVVMIRDLGSRIDP